MTKLPKVGDTVRFNMNTLPYGIRAKVGSAPDGTVTLVTWNGVIGVKPTGHTEVLLLECIDIETETAQ
jgi:hypothetical protein